MGFWGHYKVLVWKNWLLWRRHLCASLCECICPVALICFLLLLRVGFPAEDKSSQSYLFTSHNVGQLVSFTSVAPSNRTAFPGLNFNYQSPFQWCEILNSQEWGVGIVGSESQLGAGLAGYLQTSLSPKPILLFPTESALDDYVTSGDYDDISPFHPKICFAVVIDQQSPLQITYKIRFNSTDTDPNNQSVYGSWWEAFLTSNIPTVNKFQRNVETKYQEQFIDSGFMQIMSWVLHDVIRTYVDSEARVDVAFVPMYEMKWVKDIFAQNFGGTIGFFMFISMLIPLTRQIGKVTNEKETKIKETMKIMGLMDLPYWLSWYTLYITIYFVIAVLCTLVSIPIFAHSNIFVVFLMYFLYGLSCIAFSMLIISFFTRAKTAILVGVLVFFITYFVIFTIDSNTPQSTITGLSMFPSIAMAVGFVTMVGLEGTQIGSNFSNLSLNYGNYNVETALVFLVIDTVLYGLLALYFDKVIPSEFGSSLPWYFPLSPSYWKGLGKTDNSLDTDTMRVLEAEYQSNLTALQRTRRIEPVDASLLHQQETGQAMLVRGLRKQFGSKVAVDGVDLDMYEGQIFALLGHNGAGKTTTISILTGLIDPTAGEMTVHGHSMKADMAKIRRELGVCPQHDVLFPDLTVWEHLYMFSVFKGMRDQVEIRGKIDQKIEEIDLVEKRNIPSKNLSGGQKRKLSLAIALIGGSSIVMLDEPTSGMDLTARRRMWDMLKNEKNKRIIILTTHYMEEADILADRIAIMADGKVRCIGSPLFLKNRYGVGYNLTIAKKLNMGSSEHSAGLTSFIHRHIPEAKLLYDVSAEVQYQLPLASTGQFQSFFKDLDEHMDQLSLEQYGISVTTLEEVFLRVAKGEDEEEDDEIVPENPISRRRSRKITDPVSISLADMSSINKEVYTKDEIDPDQQSLQAKLVTDQASSFNIAENRVKGIRLFSHMFALLQKRFWYSIRDLKGLMCEIFLPILVVVVGLALLTQFSVFASQRSYRETVTKFDSPQMLLYNTWTESTQDYSQVQAITSIMQLINTSYPADLATVPTTDILSLSNFDTEVYNTRFVRPNRMGSMYFYEADDWFHQYQVVIFQNSTAFQAVPTFYNLLSEGLLKHLIHPNFTLSCINHPLPLTKKQSNLARNTGTFYIAMIFAIGMAFIPTGLVTFIVKERENNVKHQLIVSGVSIPAYWFSYYLWDVIKHMVPAVVSAAFIKAFELKSLTDNQESYATVWILFILFGFAVAPFTYLMGFLFKSYSMAQFAVFMFSLITGAILSTASWMMRLIAKSSRDVNQGLQYIFRLSPIYCFSYGIMNASNREVYATLFGEKEVRGALDWQIAGADVIFLLVETVVYTALIFVVEWSRNVQKLRQVGGAKDPGSTKFQPDDDVERERQVAASSNPSSVAVKVTDLRQIYGGRFSKSTKVAIESVSFVVQKNECFALLGVNGAGKTSTFRILTGEYVPTSGSAYIGGSSIETEMSEARYKIGYCPQFDALSELLTPLEHLRLYARIKGVPRSLIMPFANQALENMGLRPYAHVKAGTLSGGNKRKLSVAIATIGNPPVVFLDEPSAGMDPEARKKMWKVINEIKSKQTSIILTTHSMEEAEALCDRIAIMVGGRIRCLGTSTHIKNKFGSVSFT